MRLPLALFLTVFLGYLLLSPAHFLTTPDEELNIRTTLSLLEGRGGAVPPIGGFATRQGIDGKEYAQYGLGLPIALSPWCLIGLWIDPSEDTSFNNLENVNDASTAGTMFLRGWLTVFTMAVSALTVVLCQKILFQIGLSLPKSVFFSLILAFGTYLLPHGRTLFTEPLVGLCLTAALYAVLKDREKPYLPFWIFIAGLCWAYAVFTRLDSLATLPAAAWFLCIQKEGDQYRFSPDVKKLVLFGIPIAALLVITLLYNQYRFDSFLATGYEDQTEKIKFATPLLVGLHGFLLTPGRSIFLYSPFLIFLLPGIYHLYRRDPWLTAGLTVLCGLFICAMSKWQNWAGGWDWGPRHIYQMTPLFFIFASSYFIGKEIWDTRGKRILWLGFFALSFFIQLLGLSADPVEAVRNLLQQFTQPYPQQFYPVVSQFVQQYMIYLPHFSSPVMHWNAVAANGADLLIIQAFKFDPVLMVFYSVPMVVVFFSAKTVYQRCRENS